MKIVIVVAFGLVTFLLLIAKENSRRQLLYLGLATIAVGHRGIYVGRYSFFVPLEIIFLLLFGFMFVAATLRNERHDIRLPFFLWFVTFWCLLRALISWIAGSYWDEILVWTAPFVIGLPIFWVIRRLITDGDHFSMTINILLLVSTVISILGLLEYQFPEITSILPKISSANYILTSDGFVRASFGFWGYPAAVIIVTWGMLVAYFEIINPSKSRSLWIYVGIFVIGGLAVYVSGQRSSWFALILAIILLSFSGKLKGWLSIILMYPVISFLPAIFWDRFNTVTYFVESGVVSDTSTAQRIARWSWGWDYMLQYPLFGVGYGHWLVHNAFLEIGATVGVIPAVAFLIFIIQLIWRIASVALRDPAPEVRRYAWLFLAIAVTWIMQINVETIFQTTPLAVAFWPYMALAWYLPDLFKKIPDVTPPPTQRRFIR